jgi:hypothetical protein
VVVASFNRRSLALHRHAGAVLAVFGKLHNPFCGGRRFLQPPVVPLHRRARRCLVVMSETQNAFALLGCVL